MDPRQWNQRSIEGFLNKVNNNLDQILNTMNRVQLFGQQVKKLKPEWQQLSDLIRQNKNQIVDTQQFTKSNYRSKRRKKRKRN